jgi:hypothetical protein
MSNPFPIDLGLLAEAAGRHPLPEVAVDAQKLADAAAAELRSIFAEHPKQAAFYRRSATAKLRATTKTRRAGATAGGVREYLARAIEQSGFRGTYATTTRQEAIDRAWENDTNSGFAQVLRRLGEPAKGDIETVAIGGVTVEIRVGDLALEFSNGSRIDLYGADNLRRLRVKRGNAKHAMWVDEAQDFPFLDVFYKSVVVATLTDFDGECWLTGTPGRDCAGFFYDVTGGDVPMDGWEVHALAAVDNPFFGHAVQADDALYVDDNLGVRHGPFTGRVEADEAARLIRWENAAGAAIRRNKFSLDDPDVQRELLGKWVKGDARFVYPVHAVPNHLLVYAPQRLRDNPFRATHPPWLDFNAAVADLPINRRQGRLYQWLFGVGADQGFWPDPFGLVVWAFTLELPDAFEIFSWKQTEVTTHERGIYMKMLYDEIPNLVSFVSDTVDKEKRDFWSDRIGLELDTPEKANKNALEAVLADDVRRGAVHFRGELENGKVIGSPLLTEMQHLVYLPTKPGKTRQVDKYRKVGGVVHSDTLCDAARYSYNDLTHYLYRPPKEHEEMTEIERLRREAERFERQVDDVEGKRRRVQEQEEADLEARWGPGSGYSGGEEYYE